MFTDILSGIAHFSETMFIFLSFGNIVDELPCPGILEVFFFPPSYHFIHSYFYKLLLPVGSQAKGPRPFDQSFSKYIMQPLFQVIILLIIFALHPLKLIRWIKQICLTFVKPFNVSPSQFKWQRLPLIHPTSRSAGLTPFLRSHQCLLYSSHFFITKNFHLVGMSPLMLSIFFPLCFAHSLMNRSNFFAIYFSE